MSVINNQVVRAVIIGPTDFSRERRSMAVIAKSLVDAFYKCYSQHIQGVVVRCNALPGYNAIPFYMMDQKLTHRHEGPLGIEVYSSGHYDIERDQFVDADLTKLWRKSTPSMMPAVGRVVRSDHPRWLAFQDPYTRDEEMLKGATFLFYFSDDTNPYLDQLYDNFNGFKLKYRVE